MDIIEMILAILSGLITAIPLVVQLIKYVKTSVREKNWAKVLELVVNLMATAENMFATGAERKSWVMMAIKASADTIDYDIDMEQVSKLIDDLCAMSKVVNAEIKEITEEKLHE